MPTLLMAYRPCDPGAGQDEMTPPSQNGWLTLQLTAEQASNLVSIHEWYLGLDHSHACLEGFTTSNLALNVPNEYAIKFWRDETEIAELFTEHKNNDAEVAVLPAFFQADQLETDQWDYNLETGTDSDLVLTSEGAHIQLFFPDIQLSLETALLPDAFLRELAAGSSD